MRNKQAMHQRLATPTLFLRSQRPEDNATASTFDLPAQDRAVKSAYVVLRGRLCSYTYSHYYSSSFLKPYSRTSFPVGPSIIRPGKENVVLN